MTDAANSVPVELRSLADRKPKVLLVDDAPRVRLVVAACLRARGFEIVEATTESAAMATVESRGREIDLVFADVSTDSRIDGLRLLKSLLARLPNVPLILISSDAERAYAARELSEHATIVTKPYCIDDLAERLDPLVM